MILQWKQNYGHEDDYYLQCELYAASVYKIEGRWGGEVGGPTWDDLKVYKPIYREKETAQDRVVNYIVADLDRRHKEMFSLIEELEHL